MSHEPPSTVVTDCCDAPCAELPRVASARARFLPKSALEERASAFRLLSEPTRLQRLHLLAETELCVCDMCDLLGASQPAVSNQLRILRAARLVRTRREGKLIFYSLDSPELAALLKATLPAQWSSI